MTTTRKSLSDFVQRVMYSILFRCVDSESSLLLCNIIVVYMRRSFSMDSAYGWPNENASSRLNRSAPCFCARPTLTLWPFCFLSLHDSLCVWTQKFQCFCLRTGLRAHSKSRDKKTLYVRIGQSLARKKSIVIFCKLSVLDEPCRPDQQTNSNFVSFLIQYCYYCCLCHYTLCTFVYYIPQFSALSD